MRKAIRYLLGPIISGLFIALIIISFFPQLINPDAGIIQVFTTEQQPTPPREEPTSPDWTGPVSYSDAVDLAAPAVANIWTTTMVKESVHPLLEDPAFRKFFGLENTPQQRRMLSSLGSAVIVSPQGYLLTNNHVIRDADIINVALKDGREAIATVVGTDPETDLAVLHIDLPNLPSITLANSDNSRVGDVVLAIGNPYGFGQTVTMGIVSAKGRAGLNLSIYEDFIQIDAAINPGNSGGALVNAYGNLVGINTAIFSKTGGSNGIGFAIPSSLAQKVMLDIIQKGKVTRGWLGIVPLVQDTSAANYLNEKKIEGVVILDLFRNGPAHLAGIRPGDIITHINGVKIENEIAAMTLIAEIEPGSKVPITVLRNGKTLTLTAVIGERPGLQQ